MKRLFFAFLCVLLLCVPILCMSETTEIAYACDTCGNQDICSVIVTGEGEMGGAWGEYYDVVCQCGACLFSSWRQTGPAPAAEPEPPVVPPAEPEYHRPVNNDPPAEPEYIQPVNNDTPTNTGSGDPPAIVVQPQVLLMDEPLSNLDASHSSLVFRRQFGIFRWRHPGCDRCQCPGAAGAVRSASAGGSRRGRSDTIRSGRRGERCGRAEGIFRKLGA